MLRPLLLGLTLLLTTAVCAAAPRAWRVCITDSRAPPLITQDPARPGAIERLLVDAGRAAGLETKLLRLPIERCRLMLERDELDAFLAVPVPANRALLDFPSLPNGEPDPAYRIALGHLVWIKRNDAPGNWDGRRLSGVGPQVKVGVRHGQRFGIELLQSLGLQIDSGSIDAPHVLRRLQARRFDLALLLLPEFEALRRGQPEFADLVALPRPFLVSEFYAAVSKRVDPALRPQIEAWWAALARLRDQPAYRY